MIPTPSQDLFLHNPKHIFYFVHFLQDTLFISSGKRISPIDLMGNLIDQNPNLADLIVCLMQFL